MENRQQEKTQPMDIKLQQERPSYLSDPTALTARPQSALYMDQVRRELSSGELTGRPADHRSSLDSISQLQAEAETSGPTMSALGLEMPRGDRAREPEPPATATRTRSEGILGDMQLTKRATSSFPGGAGESMLTKAVEQSKPEEDEGGAEGRDDAVRMLNCGEGSYSTTLPEEDDPAVRDTLPYQAVLKIQKSKRAGGQ
ncbi:hypothetical protein LTR37_013496 [Vermiconidia calcicola]|uniref:Uncharacterized protein n=1 Tax=Vermiconidia calcicola TaxID=1690605 RepID=A0ACC3MXC0_9PEZI|nr:hypothetical protein LTR37_013496 [Vermiconidia calcicola]